MIQSRKQGPAPRPLLATVPTWLWDPVHAATEEAGGIRNGFHGIVTISEELSAVSNELSSSAKARAKATALALEPGK